ncbi:MAG TPA: TIGR03435 family protein [Candidatus Acidoferrales bacterium]|nr:TIGR03435 family protein [Candidatus Acidoferrales bacterium]
MIKTSGAIALSLALCTAWGQPAAPLSFEVASVKAFVPGSSPGQRRANMSGADRIECHGVTLWYLITYAYGMKSYQVFGPDWLKDARYDVMAKGPAGTTREQLPKMTQALLAERLKLQVRQETRALEALALIVGKNGPKLTEAAPESGDGMGGAQIGMSTSPTGGERLDVKGASMASLATTLTGLLGRPVVDKTGLSGRYDFVLEFTRSETAGPKGTGGYNEPPPLPPPPPGAEPGQSIYSSIQQLGLKLDGQKLPLPILIIESAERTPVEN